MLSSLRTRLTLTYAVFVMLLFFLVALFLAREAVQLYARSQNEAIAAAAADIRRLADANPKQSFDSLAAQVHRTVERPGVRIIGVDGPPGFKIERPPVRIPEGSRGTYIKLQGTGGTRPSGPPRIPDDKRTTTDRLVFSIASLSGIRVQQISTNAGLFFVWPDISRLRGILAGYGVSMLVLLLVAGVLGWLIGNYLANQAVAPLVAVTGALRRVADGDFTPQSVATRERSEVGDLADAFNGAAAQIASAFDERRRVEEHIRQFVADASHELRTPLTVIVGYLDLLRRGALNDPQKRDRAFATLDVESHRMRVLIEKLIVLARLERPEPSELARVDIASVARSVAAAVEGIAGHAAIELRLDDGAHVLADEAEIHEALANLLDNARKYGENAPIEITVTRDGSHVVAQVIDGGPGIPEDEVPHIFERFYRGESRGEIEGSGLGLAIAQQATARARGRLTLRESRPGRTVFEIRLPAAPEHDAPAPSGELVLR